jgi:hypothetical protein
MDKPSEVSYFYLRMEAESSSETARFNQKERKQNTYQCVASTNL